MSRALSEYRLAQAKAALAWNQRRAGIAKRRPQWLRAMIGMEMELVRIKMTQLQWQEQRNIAAARRMLGRPPQSEAAHREAWLRQVRAIWRGVEDRLERGDGGL